jgi:hypothetical protein
MNDRPNPDSRAPRDFESLRSTIIERKATCRSGWPRSRPFARQSRRDRLRHAASIATAAEVQPSTLVRLAHHLGYEGFSDLQSIFRERLRDRRPDSYEERLNHLEQSTATTRKPIFSAAFINAASQSINRLAASINPSTVRQGGRYPGGAETIYLIAKRRSYPLTAHMSYAFGKLGIRYQIVASPNGVDVEMCSSPRSAMRRSPRVFRPMPPKASARPRRWRARRARGGDHRFGFSPLAASATCWFEVAESDFSGFPFAFRLDGADHGACRWRSPSGGAS